MAWCQSQIMMANDRCFQIDLHTMRVQSWNCLANVFVGSVLSSQRQLSLSQKNEEREIVVGDVACRRDLAWPVFPARMLVPTFSPLANYQYRYLLR